MKTVALLANGRGGLSALRLDWPTPLRDRRNKVEHLLLRFSLELDLFVSNKAKIICLATRACTVLLRVSQTIHDPLRLWPRRKERPYTSSPMAVPTSCTTPSTPRTTGFRHSARKSRPKSNQKPSSSS